MEVNLKKKNTGLIAGIAAVVVVLAIILVMVFAGGSKDPLQEQLDLGRKYMQEQNYEQAVAAYLAAIEIDDRCTEAYIGAAKAYEAMGDLDSAVEILTTGLEKTGDTKLEDALNEILSGGASDDANGEGENDGNLSNDEVVDEGRVYIVEFDDPELTQIATEFYQMIIDNPENPAGYANLVDMYLGLDYVDAAVDVAKAGYHKTGETFFKDVINWAENDDSMGNNDTTDDENTTDSEIETGNQEEPALPEPADNQVLLRSEERYYLVTFDKKYVAPRKNKVNAGGWIHFDGNGVQISVSLEKNTSFEEYFDAEKDNFDWLIEDNYITDLELGTPVQIQCGNVTAYYYEYKYIDCSDKVVEPTPYQIQEFYVDFGDGTAFTGSTDKFIDGYYLAGKDGDESRTITIEDYLRYVFLNVEKVEAAEAQ